MIRLCVILLCSFLCHHLYGQEQMTLEKAISIGLEENFQIKINEANIRIAENNDSWARAGKGPTVDLNGSYSLSVVNDNNPASFINLPILTSGLGGSIDANWLVLSGGRVGIVKDQLELAVEQQKQLQSANAHTIIRDIIQAYYVVLLQQERLTVLKELISLSRDRLAYEEVRKEFGTSNSFNLIQFEDALFSDSTNLVSQLNQIDIAKRNVNTILSIPTDIIYEYPERLQVDLESLDIDKLKSVFMENSPTLRSLYIVSELNTLNADLEKTARKPTLGINASVGFSENFFKFLKEDSQARFTTEGIFSNRFNAAVGANLNWNLYNGGVTNANIENAKIQQEINQLDILETTMQLTNQLDVLVANYNNQKSLLNLTEEQLRLAERNLEISEERFKLGQISSLDYRAIQTQYLNVAFSRVNAIYNLLNTKTEIDWLVGVFN